MPIDKESPELTRLYRIDLGWEAGEHFMARTNKE
jgi:hypothetical protein